MIRQTAGVTPTFDGGNRLNVAGLPSHLKRQAFQVVGDVCHQAPAHRLRFPRHYVDWATIDAAMGS